MSTTSLDMRINLLPTEILQDIFSHLDLWSLLRCRTVCPLWTQCIPSASPPLRKTLFLVPPQHPSHGPSAPSPKSIDLAFTVRLTGSFINNRQPQCATDYTTHLDMGEMTRLRDEHGITLHSLVYYYKSQSDLRRFSTSWNCAARPKPFWQTMLACQPPVQKIRLRFDFVETTLFTEECIKTSHKTGWDVWNPRGVMLGELLSAAFEAIRWPEMRWRYGDKDVRLLPSFQGEVEVPDEQEVGVGEEEGVRGFG